MGKLQTLRADGARLEAEWHGPSPEDAATLVFLHEGLGCVAMWREFPAALAEATGLGALVVSRQGYGGSDPVSLPRPLTYMQHEGLEVLPEVLDAAGVKQAILVGHSDGGSIALVHAGTARSHPRVLGLMLEAPHVFCEDVSIASILEAREAYEHGELRERLRKYHGDNVDGAFWGWNRAWLDPGFRAWNIEEYLPKIRVPVLVVQGEDDRYGTVAQVEAIERGCGAPVTRAMLPGCGHSPHREKAAETLAVMVGFVKGILAQRSASKVSLR
ncbi:MAG TPA: alpha/beta hydrolase [Polyangiaceae bacterium]